MDDSSPEDPKEGCLGLGLPQGSNLGSVLDAADFMT